MPPIQDPTAGPEALQTDGPVLALKPVQARIRLAPLRLDLGQHSIGSDATCTFTLQAEGVQPYHCVILSQPTQTILKAWDPRTWLNGGPVREARLKPGDRLLIGPLEFHVCEWHEQCSAAQTQADRSALQVKEHQLRLSEADLKRRQSLTEELAAERATLEAEMLGRQQSLDRREAELHQRIGDAERRCQSLEYEREGLERRLIEEHELQRDRAALEGQQQQVAQEWEHLARELEELTLHREDEKLKSQQDRAELDRWRQEIAEQREQLAEHLTAIESLQASLTQQEYELQRDRATWEGQQQQVAQERDRLAGDFEEHSVEREQYEQKLEQHRAELDRLRQEISQEQEQHAEQRTAIESLQTSLKQQEHELRRDRAALDGQQQQVSEEQDRLAREFEELALEREEQERELQQVRAELDRRQQEISEEREQLAEQRTAIERIQASFKQQEHALQRDRAAFVGQQQQVSEERGRLAREFEELALEGEGQELKLQRVRAELDRRQEEITEEQEQLAEQRAAIENLQASLKQQEQELQRDRAVFAGLQQHEQELQQDRVEVERRQQEIADEWDRLTSACEELCLERERLEAERKVLGRGEAELLEQRRQLELEREVSEERDRLSGEHQGLSLEQTGYIDQPERQATQVREALDGRTQRLPQESNYPPASANGPQCDVPIDDTAGDVCDGPAIDRKLSAVRSALAEMFEIAESESDEDSATATTVQPTGSDDKALTAAGGDDRGPTDFWTDLEGPRDESVADDSPVAEAVTEAFRPSSGKTGSHSGLYLDDAADPDSVAAYMEKLLARARNDNEAAKLSIAPWVQLPQRPVLVADRTHKRSETCDRRPTGDLPMNAAAGDQSNQPADGSPLVPRRTTDKEAIRADLASLRQVANLSARKAIAEYTWKQLRGALFVKGMLTVVACTVAAVLLTSPLWSPVSYTATGWAALGVALIAAFELAHSTTQIHRVHSQRNTGLNADSSVFSDEADVITLDEPGEGDRNANSHGSPESTDEPRSSDREPVDAEQLV